MDRPSLLVLVRHAESERNRVKRGRTYFREDEDRSTVLGVPDHLTPLTENGISQAQKTGVAIRDRFGLFDYAYHSGYLRTKQTAENIFAAYPEEDRGQIQVRQNLFIRERDSGHAYDMTDEEAEHNFPWLQRYWETFGGFFARPPSGESLAQVTERVYLFLNMLFRDRAGQRILVVTHGGTLRCFRFLLEHWDYDRATSWPEGQSPKNCGLTTYEYSPDTERLLLVEYNTTYY